MSPKLKRDRRLEWIPVERIISNENNPREKTHFSKDELLSLKESVQEHGILEPVLVQPYRDGPRDDRFLLIEGERRYTVAKDLELKEMPAVVTDRLSDHDQLLVMYHVHTQRRGWEVAEQLRTIKELIEKNGTKSEAALAKELGMSIQTLRNRLSVLNMGPGVVTEIARDRVEYTSALRVNEVVSTLKRKRPELVAKLGGEDKVQEKLLDKARERKEPGPASTGDGNGNGSSTKKKGGISQELVEAKRDLADVADVPDSVVEKYIQDPKATLRDVRKGQGSLVERRRAESLSRELLRMEREIRAFDVKLEAVPNLRQLRRSLGTLMDAAADLEIRVVEVLNAEEQ